MAVYGRVTLLGSTASGEVWNTGFAYDAPGASSSWDQSIGDAQAAAADAVTMPTNLKALLSAGQSWIGLRWEMRDKATDALIGFSEHLKTTPVVGLSSVRMPAQCAMVISLRTANPAATGRGRVYFPCSGLSLSTTMVSDLSTTGAAVGDFKTFAAAIGAAITGVAGFGATLNLAVYSRKNHATYNVTNLRMGTVVDTQRRRANALPEQFATVTYP